MSTPTLWSTSPRLLSGGKRGIALFVGSATLTLSSAVSAIPAPVLTLNLAASAFPEGGVIAGLVDCPFSCTGASIVIRDQEGTPVAGQVLTPFSGAQTETFVWISDEPLSKGLYTAEASDASGGVTQPFAVLEATGEPPTVDASLTTWTWPAGDPVSCVEPPPTQGASSFYESVEVRPLLSLWIAGLYATQFEYFVVLEGEDPIGVSHSSPTIYVYDQSAEVCYQVIARPLLGGSEDIIKDECLTTGALDLGEKDELYGSYHGTLLNCTVPPDGYFDQWCELFATAFSQESCAAFNPDPCFAARRMCPDGDNPSGEEEDAERAGSGGSDGMGSGGFPGSGASGSGAAPATGGGADDLEGGAGGGGNSSGDGGSSGGSASNPEDTGDDSRPSTEVSGCAVGATKRPHFGLGWWLLALGLLFGSRRQSRSTAWSGSRVREALPAPLLDGLTRFSRPISFSRCATATQQDDTKP